MFFPSRHLQDGVGADLEKSDVQKGLGNNLSLKWGAVRQWHPPRCRDIDTVKPTAPLCDDSASLCDDSNTYGIVHKKRETGYTIKTMLQEGSRVWALRTVYPISAETGANLNTKSVRSNDKSVAQQQGARAQSL